MCSLNQVVIFSRVLLQVVGTRGHCSALPARADVGFWPLVYQREHSYHGLPLHNLQRLPGHVYLHLSLCPAEEGKTRVELLKTHCELLGLGLAELMKQMYRRIDG